MENLRPNEERAKNAVTLIYIVLALEIMALISGFFSYNLLQTAANGGEVSSLWTSFNDITEQTIAIVYLIAYVISGVTFIQWFRRAYYNLHLQVKYLSHDEGWASGSWFVPIISLYRPYQIMKEMYQETKYLLTNNGLIFKYPQDYALGLWWTLWLINSFVGQFVFRLTLKAETIDELTTSTIAGMIGNLIGIPLALITVKVIKDYSNLESLFHESAFSSQQSVNSSQHSAVSN